MNTDIKEPPSSNVYLDLLVAAIGGVQGLAINSIAKRSDEAFRNTIGKIRYNKIYENRNPKTKWSTLARA